MKQPDFIPIPTQVLSNKNLQPMDRILFGYVYWMTKLALMKCVAGNKLLAEMTGNSERSIQASLERLEQEGYIRRVYTDQVSKHREEIQCLVAFSTLRANERSPTSKRAGGLRANAHHNKKIKNKKDLIVTNVTKPTAYGKPEINDLFDYWKEITGLEIMSRVKANRNAANNLLKKHGVDILHRLINGVPMAQADQYAPRIADFCDLQAKSSQLIVWGRQQSKSKGVKIS